MIRIGLKFGQNRPNFDLWPLRVRSLLRIFKKYIMGLFLVSSCLGVPIFVQIGTAQSELLQNNSSRPKRVKRAKILKSCEISYNRKIEIAKRCKKIESKFKRIWTQYKK